MRTYDLTILSQPSFLFFSFGVSMDLDYILADKFFPTKSHSSLLEFDFEMKLNYEIILVMSVTLFKQQVIMFI